MTTPQTEPRWARAEGLIVLAVAVACLAFQLWLPTTHVADTDYQAVASVLAAERQAHDVVLLAPWWTERARLYVPEGLPVVGYQGSDGDELTRYARVWVLAEPSQPRGGLGDFERAFSPGRTPLGEARRFGNLSLRLYQNGRHRPVTFDATEAVANAQVYLEQPDGARQPCTWIGAGFRCATNRVVSAEWHEVHFAPYRCLKLEPPGGASRLVVELTARASESSQVLAGYIWEYGAHHGPGITPSTVTLEVDGQPRSLELPVRDELMHRLEGPALPEGARVRLMISAQNPTDRVACVALTGHRRAP